MDKSLLQLLFLTVSLTGVVPMVLSVPRKYYLIQHPKTWSNAAAYCQAEHTDLATIRSDDDMAKLQNEAQLQRFNSVAWIGLYRFTHSWTWSYKNETLGTMTKWFGTGPVNNYGIEDCGVIFPAGWINTFCYAQLPSVCFDDRNASNIRYIYIPAAKTWPQAQEYCRTYYTDLASARDATASTVIQSMIYGWTWFGLFKFTWMWLDQSDFHKSMWSPGRPYNYQRFNCGSIYNSQAIDDDCLNRRLFFCYSIVTGQRQIIRLKVQSDQDVNEPAVKEEILEKIRQKLKELGMENVKLKWRE